MHDNSPATDQQEPDELRIRRQICADPAQQAAQKRKGYLPEDWLDNPQAAADPWLIHADTYRSLAHRDAYLGNGWLGQRITPDGDGSYRYGSRSYCYSCRDFSSGRQGGAIRELPRWATLDAREPQDRLFRLCEERDDYQQTLDLRTATVTTTSLRTTPGAQWHEKHRIWLARHDPHLAVLSAELTPLWGEQFTWFEELAAANDTGTVHTNVVDNCLLFVLEDGEQQIAIASRLLFPTDVEGTTNVVQEGRTIERSWQAKLNRQQTAVVNKAVSIYTSENVENPAEAALNRLRDIDLDREYKAHCDAWDQLWQSRIEVDHPRLQQLLNASLFQLYSSMRGDITWSIPPCGLSGHGWRGMIFWDAETWMYPPLNLLQPEIARSMADYRIKTLPGAQKNAAAEAMPGASYGWNSANDGIECSQSAIYSRERHISCCVILALWQQFLTSGDQQWLTTAWPVFRDVAAYWTGFVEYDGQHYHIKNVCPADEYAKLRDDNAYTNAAAARCLRLATKVAEIIGETADQQWLKVADNMYLPFDDKAQVYLEYEGFEHGTTIKQADASLMIYPWGIVDDPAMMRRLRDYYRPLYSEYLIMMAEAIDGIVSCRIGEAEDAWDITRRLLPFFRQPFFGTSESPWNEVMVFCTGLGGFLQLFLNGFAGIQLTDKELRITPALPQSIQRLVVHGLQYNGQSHTLSVDHNGHTLTQN